MTEVELLATIKESGGTINLVRGDDFDPHLCLLLENLVKAKQLRLTAISRTSATYVLRESDFDDSDWETLPHYFATVLTLNGVEIRCKVVNMTNDAVDILYRNDNGSFAITRLTNELFRELS